MNTSKFRNIHVLLLRGEVAAASSQLDALAQDLQQADPTLQVTVKTAGLGRAGQLAKTVRPDVVILDGVSADPVDAVTELDEALSDTPVLVLLGEHDQDRVHACVVAGARGCLVRPVDPDTLTATIQQVHDKASRRRRMHADAPARTATGGRLIAVRGTKGGVGTTAIATSLAVAIGRRSKQPTVLVDGHFFGGDIPVALDLVPNRSLIDLIPHLDRLDEDLFNATLTRHPSGVAVLAAPAEFERAESIRSDDYHRVLEALCARYAYVVVDCSPFLDQNNLTALDMADTLLLVTTPEMAAIKNAARLLQLGQQLGYSESKLRLVVNRVNLPGAIPPADFEVFLEYRASFRFPNDAAVARALARGEPLVTSEPASSAARALDRLARTLITNEGWDGERRRQPGRGLLPLPQWRLPFRRARRSLEPVAEAV